MPSKKRSLLAASGAGGDNLYVEDVFSTYLYEGNASGQGANAQSITNNIDLSGEGGLTWIKNRDSGGSNAWSHYWFDTERGATKYIRSNLTSAEAASNNSLSAFNSDGFTLGETSGTNNNGDSYVSWSFRKAEKFFDVVTWTGDGVAGRTVAHTLGSVPGMMIVKAASGAYSGSAWTIYHKDLTATDILEFDTGVTKSRLYAWNDTTPTDSVFTVGSGSETNGVSTDYVAYLFASDAGGFGDDGSESIVKCGTWNTTSGGDTISLGWEPQYVLVKSASTATNWYVFDSMRGMVVGTADYYLKPNTSGAEATDAINYISPTADGFQSDFDDAVGAGVDLIYMAIRRPMKTPESGTEVFATDTRGSTGDGKAPTYRSPFPVDMQFNRNRTYAGGNTQISARLTQANQMFTDLTSAESANAAMMFDYMNGVQTDTGTNTNQSAWMFKRATGFMDVVAYTGNGVAGATQAHNLGVVPEFMIVKPRGSGNWATYNKFNTATDLMYLNEIYASDSNGSIWNNTTPTDTVFTLGSGFLNTSNAPFIAYLFASLDGVSKVGSYTGTGSDLNVDCGFSAGARFILIKRTDGSQYASGGWYVWDYLRGITAGNDPYLLLNSTAAEVTNTDYIDPLSSGFTVTSTAPAALNASSGTYIFLAIA